jgi:hypothetical protein
MTSPASAGLFQQRLKVCIRPLMDRLKEFLDSADAGSADLALVLPEEDVRVAYECLLQLGLTQDAKRLVEAWRPLNDWMLGPRFDELLAGTAGPAPLEERRRLRQLFGEFPSAEDLADSAREREALKNRIVLIARQLAEQLQQLKASILEEPLTHGKDSGSSNQKSQPTTVDLPARVMIFLMERTQFLGRVPTFKEVRGAFPDLEFGSRATFYRKNKWYVTARSAAQHTLMADAPRRGHRIASQDEATGHVDASVDSPDYHANED